VYPPLNVLKPIAHNVWIVDGPAIEFSVGIFKMPFPTRMTLVRLAGDRLFVHSPTSLTPELSASVRSMGVPQWIVAPNRLHYWWIPQWRESFPEANIYLAPHVQQQAGRHIDFASLPLDRDVGYEWDPELATLPVRGSYMTEVVFFHYASRTLILTDLIENFEAEKVSSAMMRWLIRLGGVRHPDGQMPRDMRLTFRRNRSQLKAAIQKMITWDPKRVILAHGRWYDGDGARELRRAFRWLI